MTEKHLQVTTTYMSSGNFGNLEDADLICEAFIGMTYRALLVDGVGRVASQTAYKGDGRIDWVLLPYTRYLNEKGNLIWITDAVPLLGVRNGKAAPDTCSGWGNSRADEGGSVVRLETETFIVEHINCAAAQPLLCVERY